MVSCVSTLRCSHHGSRLLYITAQDEIMQRPSLEQQHQYHKGQITKKELIPAIVQQQGAPGQQEPVSLLFQGFNPEILRREASKTCTL